MHKVASFSIFMGIVLAHVPAMAQQGQKQQDQGEQPRADQLTRFERGFLKEAAKSSRSGLDAAQIAVDKATDEDVKSYARNIISEHGQLIQQLQQVASNKGVDLPPDKDVRLEKKMTQTSADNFDREFIKAMVKEHKEDVSRFEEATRKAKDPDVKQFAESALPSLRQNLQTAQSLQPQVQESGKRGGGK